MLTHQKGAILFIVSDQNNLINKCMRTVLNHSINNVIKIITIYRNVYLEDDITVIFKAIPSVSVEELNLSLEDPLDKQEIIEYIAKRIREFRPNCIVTHSADGVFRTVLSLATQAYVIASAGGYNFDGMPVVQRRIAIFTMSNNMRGIIDKKGDDIMTNDPVDTDLTSEICTKARNMCFSGNSNAESFHLLTPICVYDDFIWC